MKATVTYPMFHGAMKTLRPNQFSDEALRVLFDLLEDYEEVTGAAVEFDPIGLCCEFTEGTFLEIADAYGISLEHCEDTNIGIVREYLAENCGMYVEFSRGEFLYQQF